MVFYFLSEFWTEMSQKFVLMVFRHTLHSYCRMFPQFCYARSSLGQPRFCRCREIHRKYQAQSDQLVHQSSAVETWPTLAVFFLLLKVLFISFSLILIVLNIN